MFFDGDIADIHVCVYNVNICKIAFSQAISDLEKSMRHS